ncbi:MAG: FtsX-like permease family protein [Nitrospiraceae bacterium]|nr:FtsX-like permease family protein [Nitrospiraceae bacterium]
MSLAIICHRAVSDFRQHLYTQLITGMVVSLSILIFVFFTLIYFNLHQFVERFGTELGLVVFLNDAMPQAKIPVLYQRLTGLPGVEKVTYISSGQAFKRLKNYLKDEKGILEGIDPKFLPPSFEVRINRAVFHLKRIRQLAGEIGHWPEVSKVQYGQAWIERLQFFLRFYRILVIVSGFFLLFTAAFVVANTIKLTIYARQEELKIMRLVGATNSFIQGPFLAEAFMQGLLGSGLAIGTVFLCYRSLQGLTASSELLMGIHIYFLPWPYTIAIIASSILFCVLGTAIAMWRFLRL